MNAIIAGNIFSLCAMISDSISGTRKKHSEIMAVQIVSQLFYGAASIALKGYSSTAQNVVAIFRNFAAMKNIRSKALEWVLILAGVVLGVLLNNRGLLGWLPIIANFEYSVSVFRLKDNEKALKTAFIINMIMYAVFSTVIMNYVGVLSCSVITVTTAVSLIKTARDPDGTKKMVTIQYNRRAICMGDDANNGIYKIRMPEDAALGSLVDVILNGGNGNNWPVPATSGKIGWIIVSNIGRIAAVSADLRQIDYYELDKNTQISNLGIEWIFCARDDEDPETEKLEYLFRD